MKRKNVFISALLALAMFCGIGGVSSVVDADAATQRYEAEDATINGANVKSGYGDNTASGTWVGDMSSTSTVDFSVNVSQDGEYALTLSYASGSYTTASLLIYNAEGYFVEVDCPNTAGWGAFQTVSSTISLRAGTSTVTVKKGAEIAELDYIEIGDRVGDYKTGNTETIDPNDITQPNEGYTRYETENGTRSDGTTLYTEGQFSGTGYVGDLNTATAYVAVTVNVAQDGEYNLAIAYATGLTGSTIKVHNGDGFYTELSCSTVRNWGVFTKEAIAYGKISLRSGNNTVKVYKGTEYAQIDFIEIGARVGDYKQSSETDSSITSGTAGYTRYEAEEGTLHSANIHSGGSFSGTGFVADMDTMASGFTVNVTVAEDGEYQINVAYAIGSEDQFKAATIRMYANDTYFGILHCDKRLGWGNFTKEAIASGTISLRAGQNAVKITKGNEYAQVDFIEIGARVGDYKEPDIGGDAPPVTGNMNRYEVEDGYVVNAIRKGVGYVYDYGNGNYSGKGFVGSIDNSDCYIDIPVTVSQSGSYTIAVRYATGSTECRISIAAGNYGVDGRLEGYGDKTATVMNITNWGEFADENVVTFSVGLNEGDFVRVSGLYVEVDCIEVSERTGEYVKGTNLNVQSNAGSGEFDDNAWGDGEDIDYGDGYVPARPEAQDSQTGSSANGNSGGCGSSIDALSGVVTMLLVGGAFCLFKAKNKKEN